MEEKRFVNKEVGSKRKQEQGKGKTWVEVKRIGCPKHTQIMAEEERAQAKGSTGGERGLSLG